MKDLQEKFSSKTKAEKIFITTVLGLFIIGIIGLTSSLFANNLSGDKHNTSDAGNNSDTGSGNLDDEDETVANFTNGFGNKYVHSYAYSGTVFINASNLQDAGAMDSLFPTRFYLFTDPVNASNQVLRVVNKSGGTTAGYTDVLISNDNPSGNCYTFETKMYLETLTSGYGIAQIMFSDENANSAFTLNVTTNSDKKLVISTTDNDVYPSAGTNLLVDSGIVVSTNEWFKIRAEFYYEGEKANKQNTYLKLYITFKKDGKDVEVLAYDGNVFLKPNVAVDRVHIVHTKSKQSIAVYYDDISFTKVSKTYNSESNSGSGPSDEGGSSTGSDLITFSIDSITYTAEPGMTWGDWCSNNEYSHGDYLIEENFVIKYDSLNEKYGWVAAFDDDLMIAKKQLSNDEIIPNFDYWFVAK